MARSVQATGTAQGEGHHSTTELSTAGRWELQGPQQLRREIAELDLLHREAQKGKPKTLRQERRERQQRQERAHTARKVAAIEVQTGPEQGARSSESSKKQAKQHAEQHRDRWAQYVVEWKKVEKEAGRRPVKQMQARIR